MFNRLFGDRQAKDESGQERETPLQREIRMEAISTLKEIYDPEIPVNIYDLGLIYDLSVDVRGRVFIKMTLTTPACPVAQSFPEIVANRVRMIAGVSDVIVDLVWDPPWSQDRMTEAARLQLGLF